ncbi:MAG: hypothetical protein JAY85_16290 [Candidatus Thiodiazotropha weberae]|nr:hypothetical protein [Candidatus Thiodiazotropha endoloripes]MCG7900004.1 hypothetical protein [Candidatus Thiodiazotropha weberae]MCG7902883.1 hypothetical protein [Candidatus Thiodiazotropha weberae]MCG7912564.1 hypothetical protein [Candidatus Thiodiazotropha weberae]
MAQRHNTVKILMLVLLLIQAPLVMAWSMACAKSGDSPMSGMSETMQHHCHDMDAAVELADCESMHCMFCGFTVQLQVQPVTFTVSHILYIGEGRVPAPPRPEQPVELQPPINSLLV